MFGPPFSPSDPRGVLHIDAWFSIPTCRFTPSGVIPVALVPGLSVLPPFGTFGVNHCCCASSSAFRLKSEFPAALFPFCAGVPAIGVGQFWAASCGSGPPAARASRWLFAPPVTAFAVGHDEDPLPFMACADFRR
jgi:hypothetical protein